jgi:hypothetical protein
LGRKVIEYKLEHLWNENNKRDLFRYIWENSFSIQIKILLHFLFETRCSF